jgi:GrpB-like predicted nucleotidyltransferase (UPF0157 family)
VDESPRQRLADIGVDADAYGDPFDVWVRLRAAEGPRVSLIDLYALAADRRGVPLDELPAEERDLLSVRGLGVMFQGFEIIPGTDRPLRDLVEIVPYDDSWPSLYDTWSHRLATALGPIAKRIEHIGSTAVSGLPAKPVIDIQVSVDDMMDEARYVPAIEALGVQLRSRDDEHRYFRPFSGRPRAVQVHVCAVGSRWERVHLLFRDYLRADAAARLSYTESKREAAAHWRDDRIAYTEAKTGTILNLIEAAEAWAKETGWHLASAV